LLSLTCSGERDNEGNSDRGVLHHCRVLCHYDKGLDEGSDKGNPNIEPDEAGPSRDLASAPSGVSIFNNLGTPEDQVSDDEPGV